MTDKADLTCRDVLPIGGGAVGVVGDGGCGCPPSASEDDECGFEGRTADVACANNFGGGGFGGGPTSASATKAASASASASALLISASDKAGMVGIDRERINAILLRESGNSTFMQRQRRADETLNQKIEEMKRRLKEKDEWHRHQHHSADKSDISYD
jgi:hypothetical protein